MKSSYPHPLAFQPLQIVSTLRILIIRPIEQEQGNGRFCCFFFTLPPPNVWTREWKLNLIKLEISKNISVYTEFFFLFLE